ncbi:Uncharacterised protein [Escherichia coli]|nr:Uncharacterised protein [Escherichia coli]
MHHLDQLGRVRVEIDHIARLFRRLGAGVHRHRDICLRQRRSIVGAVAGHRYQTTFRLILTDQCQLGLRCRFGEKIIDTRFRSNRGGSQTVIAGNHHRFNAHFAQLGEALFNTAFDDIFQRNNAQHTRTFHHHQRRGSLTRNLIDFLINIGREVTTVSLNMATNGIDRTFTDHAVVDVDPAHPALRSKRYKGGMERLHIALAQVKTLLGEDHNTAAFRRFISQRSQLCGVSQRFFIHALRGDKLRRLTVTECDGAGFIQ